MSDKLTLWNMALSLVGVSEQLSSLTEDSVEKEQCELHYDLVRKIALSAAHWPCSKRVARLAAAATRDFDVNWTDGDPSPEYKYAFTIPSDYLYSRHLDDFTPFSVELLNNTTLAIMANSKTPTIHYSFDQQTVATFDDQLFHAIAAGLASKICYALTGKIGVTDRRRNEANQILLQARASVANKESDEEYDFVPHWIQARGYTESAPDSRFVYPYGPLFTTQANPTVS